ncbi:LytR/AlgR family response regulator transcription factor [Prevotella sp. OH937_COT-195]|uniref:LytR/AlgR family response regulator transcription factor n=1 Tax=Prevotella sp. OH937_COT-195 TaxID=2491051 RepID=UPI000F64690F|nr:LytTR family DNA-binding domain-containing protein [Prevotella sp. OH937_COT-195]RRD02661.1 DNA-binding response regulator [Prevotella sp. OH937_COT-195]
MCDPVKCIIIDDEPIAREGLERLVYKNPVLELVGNFESAESAAEYMRCNSVDLIFLDIEMPGTNGIDFARKIPSQTLVVFTTAYSEYALDSYEVNATDYLVKPIEEQRFHKAVEKVCNYHTLLVNAEKETVEADVDFFFVKSERRYYKVRYDDILFIEGLKDYVIIQTGDRRIITKMYLRTIHELLPRSVFFRINKSYVVNLDKIESFDSNDVFIGKHEIGIGNAYKEDFYKRLIK